LAAGQLKYLLAAVANPGHMKLKISYFGHLREKAGLKSETIEAQTPPTLGDLLEPVCRKRNLLEEVFGTGDQPQTSVNILVNGRNMRFLGGMDTALKEGDEVSIFPPTGGG